MNKYFLVGEYINRGVTSSKKADYITVRVPFRNSKNNLKYGINHALKNLNAYDIYPTEDGLDILSLAGLVYLSDTRISRSLHSEDSWTREISIELPVYNLEKWEPLTGLFKRMLDFLTGDRWTIIFTKRYEDFLAKPENITSPPKFDAVTLFSGGMDSLIGTINHLEKSHKTALISHSGDSFTKKVQRTLLVNLKNKYPAHNPLYLDLRMVFEKDLIPNGGIENTTRSRSFLFIAFGIFAISGMKEVSILEVPENGLIALNVPLDELRIGSHSTRTTHPFYLELWNQVLNGLGLKLSIQNPYWNKTKGEMANECLNKEFLLQVIKDSVSCSSPHKARWSGISPRHCGYCVPCIIRRAAIKKAFEEEGDNTTYCVDNVQKIVSNHAKNKGVQLRSFQIAIDKIKEKPQLAKFFVYKSGPLDNNEDFLQGLSAVYHRGLIEIDDFIIECCQTSLKKI